jgi:hypothetical protein
MAVRLTTGIARRWDMGMVRKPKLCLSLQMFPPPRNASGRVGETKNDGPPGYYKTFSKSAMRRFDKALINADDVRRTDYLRYPLVLDGVRLNRW